MTTIWVGLGVGGTYALIALTFQLVLSTTSVFNFAQPQIVMLATFGAYICIVEHGLPVPVALLVCAGAGFGIAVVEERVAIRPLGDARGSKSLVTTLGAALVMSGAALAAFGPDPRTIAFFGGDGASTVLGGRLLPVYIYIFVSAVVLAVILHAITRLTPWGLSSRALMSDKDLAALRGVNVRRMTTVVFGVSGALAGGIGVLLASSIGSSFDLGNNLVVFAFLVMTIGSAQSYLGALAAGIGVGILQAVCDRYLETGMSFIVLFFVFLLLLLVKPNGLFGRLQGRTV